MIDPFVLLAPTFLLPIIALLCFVGCADTFGPAGMAPPTNLRATPGDAEVDLSWDPYSGATDFTVYRGISQGGPYPVSFDTGGTETTYADGPLTNGSLMNGTPYYYVLTATTSEGETLFSNEASATPVGP